MDNTSSAPKDFFLKFGIWLNRIVIVGVSGLFTVISLRYLIDPVTSASAVNIALNSGTAESVVRVGLGALPLAFVIVILTSLFSVERLYSGIRTIVIIFWTVTAARLYAISLDGTTEFNLRVLKPEIIICILSAIGLYLEVLRKKRDKISQTKK